jgi:beta-glucanase (GH16 family)
MWLSALLAIVALSGPSFADEFDGPHLAATWRTCHWWADRGCTIATNHEREAYQPGQVRLRDGRVELVAERRATRTNEGAQRAFTSGMISTGPGAEGPAGFAFRYGRVRVRARLPRGDGLWPALWLLPASRESEPEIDLVEVYSDAPRTAEMHLHTKVGSLGEEWRGLDAGWHVFGLNWRKGRLDWLIDGQRRWTVRGRAVPATRMYLIANLAVSRRPRPTADTPSPAGMAIDWVRVWR